MTDRDQEEQNLRIEMLKRQHDLVRMQLRWKTPREIAVMAIIIGVIAAAFFGGAASLVHRNEPQALFPPGTVITIPPADTTSGTSQ